MCPSVDVDESAESDLGERAFGPRSAGPTLAIWSAACLLLATAAAVLHSAPVGV